MEWWSVENFSVCRPELAFENSLVGEYNYLALSLVPAPTLPIRATYTITCTLNNVLIYTDCLSESSDCYELLYSIESLAATERCPNLPISY